MTQFAAPASDYLSSPVRSVLASASAREVDDMLREHSISALLVTDADARPLGVVSRTDLLRSADGAPGGTFALPEIEVRALMTADPQTVEPDTKISDVARLFLKHRIHRVFVGDDARVHGVISTRDLMRAVVDKAVALPCSEIATTGVVSVRADDDLALATERLDVANKHGLVVLEQGWPVGMFSQRDALVARAREPGTAVGDVMSLHVLCLPASLPVSRAASQALTLGVRRIVLMEQQRVVGVVSSFDFARVMR